MEALASLHQACPFCGSYNLTAAHLDDVDDTALYDIYCNSCDASGPLVAGTPDRAWAAWDLRSETPQHWLDPEVRETSHPLAEDKFLRGLARPCPFCGNRALKCDGCEDSSSAISCLTCEASASGQKEGDEAALSAWNTRSQASTWGVR